MRTGRGARQADGRSGPITAEDPSGGASGAGGTRLNSWKQIARYLGRDVRTAMRWEREAGMPVRRVPGRGSRGPVFAYTDELDGWLHGGGAPANNGGAAAPTAHAPTAERTGVHEDGAEALARADSAADAALPLESPPAPPRKRPSRLVIGAAGSGLILTGILLVLPWQGRGRAASVSPVVSVESVGRQLVARGIDGQVLWSHLHPRGRTFLPGARLLRPGDSDEEGLLVASSTVGADTGGREAGELLAFDAAGSPRWHRSFEDVILRFGTEEFGQPWAPSATESVSAGGTTYLLAALHHYTWWPAFLSVLDLEGRELGRFVNAGWIFTAKAYDAPDGPRVLAGGISNSRGAAMMAVIDPRDPAGTSPEDPTGPYQCGNCGEGGPLAYMIFERTDVTVASGEPYNRTYAMLVGSPGLRVVVHEGPPAGDAHWLYVLDAALVPRRVEASDNFWIRHDEFHARRLLDHPASACPARVAPPPVRVWTAEHGWVDHAVTW